MITFAQARATVAASDSVREMLGDFAVADYGWENGEVFEIAANPVTGMAVFDAPALLVDKRTGKLTEVYGLLGGDPVPDLAPIGTPPQ